MISVIRRIAIGALTGSLSGLLLFGLGDFWIFGPPRSEADLHVSRIPFLVAAAAGGIFGGVLAGLYGQRSLDGRAKYIVYGISVSVMLCVIAALIHSSFYGYHIAEAIKAMWLEKGMPIAIVIGAIGGRWYGTRSQHRQVK